MKNFKKTMSLILCVVLVCATCLTTGCSKNDSKESTDATPTVAATEAPEVTEAPAENTDTTTPEVTEAPAEEITEAPAEEITEAPAETTTDDITEAPIENNDDTSDIIEVGEGATTFAFTCTDADKNSTVFAVSTDETTVGAALLNAGLIAGEDSEYGLYVKEVNGIVADWDIDGTYWAFYIDGEYAMTGVDSTEINADSVYSFVVE